MATRFDNLLDEFGKLPSHPDCWPTVDEIATPLENPMTRASEAIPASMEGVFHSKKGFVSGTPIFVGTRVPLKNLFDYLAGGHNLEEFLYDFPGVSREQAVSVLDMAGEVLESAAYETVARRTGAEAVKKVIRWT